MRAPAAILLASWAGHAVATTSVGTGGFRGLKTLELKSHDVATGPSPLPVEAARITTKQVFARTLMVCNAYPTTEHDSKAVSGHESASTMLSNAHMSVDLNNAKHLTHSGGIHYKGCENFGDKVKEGDKLTVRFGEEAGSSFRLGSTLPQENTLLLLVVTRAAGSSLAVKFQSYAFPASTEGAHVAIIDAFHHRSDEGRADKAAAGHLQPLLQLADHSFSRAGGSPRLARHEKLHFNRVYELDAGRYDLQLSWKNQKQEGDVASSMETEGEQAKHLEEEELPRSVDVAKGKDYVILQTGGDDDGDSQPVLVVYPKQHHSAATLASPAILTFLVAIALHAPHLA